MMNDVLLNIEHEVVNDAVLLAVGNSIVKLVSAHISLDVEAGLEWDTSSKFVLVVSFTPK